MRDQGGHEPLRVEPAARPRSQVTSHRPVPDHLRRPEGRSAGEVAPVREAQPTRRSSACEGGGGVSNFVYFVGLPAGECSRMFAVTRGVRAHRHGWRRVTGRAESWRDSRIGESMTQQAGCRTGNIRWPSLTRPKFTSPARNVASTPPSHSDMDLKRATNAAASACTRSFGGDFSSRKPTNSCQQ